MSPLSGITVADFTHHVAGPTCTQLLGQLGAEVVKIEPIHGEAGRHAGTVRVGGNRWTTSYFAHNKGKRSIAVDLKNQSGMNVIKAIVAKSDVLVENFRPGVLDRLGLSYETALALNPKIIYCSISGFGKDGPYRNKPALDLVLQAMGGLMSLTGTEGGPSVPAGAPVADTVSGIFATVGVLAALHESARTGVGQRVDLAMLDVVCALMGARFQQYFATGKDLPALGSGHPQATPWQTFEASDGAFVVTVNTDPLWLRLCEAMGLQELGQDERLRTAAGRLQHRGEITAALSRQFREHPRAHWSALLDRAGVPSGPVLAMSEVAAHPQVVNNGIFPEVPGVPGARATRMPIRIPSVTGPPASPPPVLGAHTRTILQSLGYSEPEIARLEAEAVIYAAQEDSDFDDN